MSDIAALTPAEAPLRRLTTVAAVDVCGYSRLAETDEAAALRIVQLVAQVFGEIAARRRGRIFHRAGDGFLAEFPSASDGVLAALELVEDLRRRDTLSPNGVAAKVRVGVHVGDVVDQPSGDLLGHGVNVASRLQGEADPGGVLASLHAVNLIRDKIDVSFRRRGPLALRHIDEPVTAFDVVREGARRSPRHRWKRIASYSISPLIGALIAAALLSSFNVGWLDPSAAGLGGIDAGRVRLAASRIRTESPLDRDVLRIESILGGLARSKQSVDQEAFSLIERGDLSAAIRLLNSKLDKDAPERSVKERLDQLHRIGAVAFDFDTEAAKIAYERIIDLEPDNFLAHARLGQLNYQQSHSAESNRQFERALQIGTPNADERLYTQINYATSLIVQERYEDALERLSAAAAESKRRGFESLYSRAQTRIAYAQMKSKAFDAARATIMAILPFQIQHKFSADRAVSLEMLGRMALDARRYDEARRLFKEAYDIESATGRILGMTDTLFYLGLVAAETGKLDEASSAFDSGLDLARANQMINMQIKNLVGKALVEKKRGESARVCDLLDRAAALHTDDIVYNPWTTDIIEKLACPFAPLGIAHDPS